MRTAAELRAAAVATGWFDGPRLHYVGDGYSIPWQTGTVLSPVFSGTLLLWKSYLDTHFLEPSRLHDWLYCPYGPNLIDATREESDLALREEMLAAGATAPECEIVYQACRLGGTPYFGVSTVGYVQPAAEPVGDNMVSTSTKRGSAMADFKVVVVFQQTTIAGEPQPSINYAAVARTGGWTESFWVTNTTVAGVVSMLKGPRSDSYASAILRARALCLNNRATILGVRLYEGGGGRGQFISMSYPGQWPGADTPSMCLLCSSFVPATPSVRRFSLRGMPDDQVVNGEFAPNGQYTTALRTYFQSLTGTAYRGRNAVTAIDVFNISSVGLVTARSALSFAAGTIVYIKSALDSGGRRRSGQYVVGAPGPLATQLTLVGWPYGDTTKGKISLPSSAFFTLGIDSTSAVRISNHKVGRPFAGYRGRASRRAPVPA